ncbi:MAG: carbon starvation CstA family protein, partial [Thermocrispum sp.]
NSTVDGVLAALFAGLVILVIGNAALVCWRAAQAREPLPTTEEPWRESTIVAPAGLIPTAAEKQELAAVGAPPGGSGTKDGAG